MSAQRIEVETNNGTTNGTIHPVTIPLSYTYFQSLLEDYYPYAQVDFWYDSTLLSQNLRSRQSINRLDIGRCKSTWRTSVLFMTFTTPRSPFLSFHLLQTGSDLSITQQVYSLNEQMYPGQNVAPKPLLITEFGTDAYSNTTAGMYQAWEKQVCCHRHTQPDSSLTSGSG